MTEQTKANWLTINVDSLPQEIQDNYAAYKAAYALMKEARGEFEASMTKAASPKAGERLVFGYNFGKLSIALVPDTSKPKVDTKAKSLAEFLAVNSERRV